MTALAIAQRKFAERSWVWTKLALLSLAAAVILTSLAQPRSAYSAADPAAFLESYGDRAISLLSDGTRTEAERRGDFRDLLSEGFDLESISAFVLTPYWRQASGEQRQRFIAVFQSVLTNRFLPLFQNAKSESFSIESARNIGDRDDLYSVETVLRSDDGRRVNTSWRIKRTGEGFRILDVSVEGASMAHTFRDEYRTFVRRSDEGIDGLIRQLEKRAAG